MGLGTSPLFLNGQPEKVGYGDFKPHIDYLSIIDKEIIATRIINKLIELGFLRKRGLKSIQEIVKLLADDIY